MAKVNKINCLTAWIMALGRLVRNCCFFLTTARYCRTYVHKFIPTAPLLSSIHYTDVIMTTMASQITSLTLVYSIVCSGADQRKHQSSASLAFVWGIHRGPVKSPPKGPETRKMFPVDDVIMDGHIPLPSLTLLPGMSPYNRLYVVFYWNQPP